MDYQIREIRESEYPILADFGKEDDWCLIAEAKEFLKDKGYKQTSLSVQKENYAVDMYRKAGFEMISENDEEYIMVCKL